jgi:hypothetical protein
VRCARGRQEGIIHRVIGVVISVVQVYGRDTFQGVEVREKEGEIIIIIWL